MLFRRCPSSQNVQFPMKPTRFYFLVSLKGWTKKQSRRHHAALQGRNCTFRCSHRMCHPLGPNSGPRGWRSSEGDGTLRGALPWNIPENQELPCDLSDDLDLYFILIYLIDSLFCQTYVNVSFFWIAPEDLPLLFWWFIFIWWFIETKKETV